MIITQQTIIIIMMIVRNISDFISASSDRMSQRGSPAERLLALSVWSYDI